MPDLLSKVCTEIDARLRELRPLVAEYERMLDAARALGVDSEEAATSPAPRAAPPPSRAARRPIQRNADAKPRRQRKAEAKPRRARRGAAEHAILAALEHGSHTVSELVIVTAMSGPNVRSNLRRLLAAQAVTRTLREGKAAYALSASTD